MNQPTLMDLNMPFIQVAIRQEDETPAPPCLLCPEQSPSSAAYCIDNYEDIHYSFELREVHHLDEDTIRKQVWEKLVEEQMTSGPMMHERAHLCLACILGQTINVNMESSLTWLPDKNMMSVLFMRPINKSIERYALFSKYTPIKEVVRALYQQDPAQDTYFKASE